MIFAGCADKHPNLKAYLEAFNQLEEVKTFKESSYFHESPVNAPMARVNN